MAAEPHHVRRDLTVYVVVPLQGSLWGWMLQVAGVFELWAGRFRVQIPNDCSPTCRPPTDLLLNGLHPLNNVTTKMNK